MKKIIIQIVVGLLVAAAARAGLSVEDIIERIVADAAVTGGRACR